jgi:1-acyl-sn-glycerol-3-phosphate acyltransferase
MENFFLTLYNYFQKRKALLVTLVLVIVAACVYDILKLKPEEDISKFVPKDEKLKKYADVFENIKINDKLIICISLTDEKAAPQPDLLIKVGSDLGQNIKKNLEPEFIKDITYKSSGDQMLDVYSSFFNNMPFYLNDDDYKKIDEIIEPENIDSTLHRDFKTLITPAGMVMKDFITRDPLSLTRLSISKLSNLQIDGSYEVYNDFIFSKDRKNLLIFINTQNPSNETGKNSDFLKKLDDEINTVKAKYSGTEVFYYGAVAVGVGNADQLKYDTYLTMLIAIVLIFILVGYFFRKKRVILFITLPVAFGAVFSLALMYVFKTKISAIAVGSASIVLGIAINYSIHFFTHLKHTGSVRTVIKDLTSPLTIGSTTTIGAFLSLLFVKSEALRDFGLFSALVLIGTVLFTLIVLPHLAKTLIKNDESYKVHEPNFIENISAYHFEKNRYLIFIIGFLTVVFIFLAQNVKFESDMSKMGYMSEKLQKAEFKLNNISDSSLKTVYVVSTGKNLQEALNNNNKYTPIFSKLQDDNLIKSYSSVSSLLLSDSMQDEKIKKWNTYWTQEKKDELKKNIIESGSKYKFRTDAFDNFFSAIDKKYSRMSENDISQIRKLFLDEYITVKKDISMVVTIIKTKEKNKPFVTAAFPEDNNLVIIDKAYMAKQYANIIVSDFNTILMFTSLLVFVFLVLLYGRIELGIIAFLPMFMSWFWILGMMSILGLKFNVINIILSAFIFGCGDDFSIFIMDGLLTEYKTGKKNINSYKTAVFLSALTTIIGIGVLIFAKHPALKSIALITIAGMFSVVLLSYTVAPVIFRWMVYTNGRKRAFPLTLFHLLYAFVSYSYYFGSCLTAIIIGGLAYLLPIGKKRKKRFAHYLIWLACQTTVYVMFLAKKRFINYTKDTFKKPAVIMCNHQSMIDIPLTLALSPKVIMIINEKYWNARFLGVITRLAGFLPNSYDHKGIMEKYQQYVDEGYSLLVFAEGTRSYDTKLQRFHKGAAFFAEKLNLDILPVVIHGTSHYIRKKEYFGKKSIITVKYLDRITPDNLAFKAEYSERTKLFRKYFQTEFDKVLELYNDPDFYKDQLIRNYIYKGPVLEWYLRVKLKLEHNYRPFHDLIPKEAKILDIGCGYGFLAYMLSFLSEKRLVTGIDFDEEKIEIADNCLSKNDRISFLSGDIAEIEIDNYDVFVLSDVLHYLQENEQLKVLSKCINHLNNKGRIIIRDADKGLKRRHKGTRFTEFFSTKFFHFNKTKETGLCYVSRELITELALKNGLRLQIIDNSKYTSNIIYIIEK